MGVPTAPQDAYHAYRCDGDEKDQPRLDPNHVPGQFFCGLRDVIKAHGKGTDQKDHQSRKYADDQGNDLQPVRLLPRLFDIAFADGVPALSTLGGDEKAIEAIAAQQRIEMMMRPLEAWSEQRRTDYPKLEVPEMIRTLYTDLISRWPYPSRESLVNDNVPQVDGIWTKMWFQK